MNIMALIEKLQKNERFEKEVYKAIANSLKNEKDRNTLLSIATEEERHYQIWKKATGKEIYPSRWKVMLYAGLSRIFGYTFIIKLMEYQQSAFTNANHQWMENANTLAEMKKIIPEIEEILKDELEHERELIELIDEDKMKYVGSMVLGLNDALVEFSGSLAGWTFAMQSNRLISLAGLITGIAATLSMASSEYLSAKNEGHENALKSALYTGAAYLLTVGMLLLPYLLLPEKMFIQSLVIMLGLVIVIIAGFNYYIAVARNESFRKKFKEMALVSLSVAGISFLIGLLVKQWIGIDL